MSPALTDGFRTDTKSSTQSGHCHIPGSIAGVRLRFGRYRRGLRHTRPSCDETLESTTESPDHRAWSAHAVIRSAIPSGRATVAKPGKLLRQVEQITYSGEQALKRGHEAVFVTERAVFHLTQGLVLTEVAPGVDIRRDILDAMDFAPLIPAPPRLMDAALFADA